MPDQLVKQNATLGDTIQLILFRINHDYKSEFIQKLAKALNPTGDKVAYMRRLFDYVCRNVKYKLDKPGKEDVYRPTTTIRNGHGDCKKMTVLIASVLKAAGIEPLIKHVFYNGENYTHVYVIVPYPNLHNYITIDPVNDCKWNEEVNYSTANIFDLKGNRMDLYTGNKPKSQPQFLDHVNMVATSLDNDLANIMGCNTMGANHTEATLNAIFEEGTSSEATMGRKKLRERLKQVFDQVKNVVKKVGVGPTRGSFLALVRLNAFHLANHLALAWKQDKAAIEDLWKGLGGNVDELKKTIVAGSGMNVSGMGQGIAAIVATATPIIVAIMTKLKKMGIVKDGDKVDNTVQDALDTASQAVDNGNVPETEMRKMPPDSGSPQIKNITKVITKEPSETTKKLLQQAPNQPQNDGGGGTTPHLGSFVSIMGICFKTPLLLMMLNLDQHSLAGIIAGIISTYCITGIFFIIPYSKGKCKWYFDLPISVYEKFLFSLKKFSLKKIKHGT